MRKQKSALNKGLRSEEALRLYFLELGYYVVRGVRLYSQNDSVTDIDLWLYNRVSPIVRHKTNVDLKNRSKPKAMERIIWAKGVQQILRLDSCVVATTSSQDIVKEFGDKHDVIVLDGNFLKKIIGRFKGDTSRLSEEEFLSCIQSDKNDNRGKEWVESYHVSKSILLRDADFNACNFLLGDLQHCVTNYLSLGQRQMASLRLTYLVLSYLLILLDCVLKDMIFLEKTQRREILANGLRFGDNGKETLDKLQQVIGKDYYNTLSSKAKDLPTEIIAEHVSNAEVYSCLFDVAKKLEALAYSRSLICPDKLESQLQSIVAVFLDYFKINRRKFFDGKAVTKEKSGQSETVHSVRTQKDLFAKSREPGAGPGGPGAGPDLKK